MIRTDRKIIILAIASFLAGIINGMLGVGGGIIIYFILSLFYKNGKIEGADEKNAFAGAIFCVFIISVIAFIIYMQNSEGLLQKSMPYAFPGMIGGVAGAILLGKINVEIVKKIFAGLLIYSGITMIIR